MTNQTEDLKRRACNTTKPRKNEAQTYLETLYRNAETDEQRHMIAALYSKLIGIARPKPNKYTDAFSWVARATGTDTTVPFTLYVRVEESRMYATDGRRLHVANFIDRDPGLYLPDGTYYSALDSTEAPPFPNLDRVIPSWTDRPDTIDLHPTELTVNNTGNRAPIPTTPLALNRTYLTEACQNSPTITVHYSESTGERQAVLIPGNTKPDTFAVIMTMESD